MLQLLQTTMALPLLSKQLLPLPQPPLHKQLPHLPPLQRPLLHGLITSL